MDEMRPHHDSNILPKRVRLDNAAERNALSNLSKAPYLSIPEGLDENLAGMNLYTQGVLCLDWKLRIQATPADFLNSLLGGLEKIPFLWTLEKPSVGGAPAHAARAAGAKGVSVAIGANLPKTLPDEFERFFEEFEIDTRFFRRATDGTVPQTLKLQFLDGTQRLIVDSGGGTYAVPLPGCEHHFDVLLIHPGGPDCRRSHLPAIRERIAQDPRATVALIGRSDWSARDWESIQNLGLRVYLNEGELAQSVAASTGLSAVGWVEGNLARLKRLAIAPTITATMGQRGCMLLNGQPFLTHVPAATTLVLDATGAGDTYATTDALSVATGAPDGLSARRGNMDAGRHVAGRAPAGSLRELDRETAQQPGMFERHIPLPVMC
jgi:sugar/nucleoside kinase (ribokinase family)